MDMLLLNFTHYYHDYSVLWGNLTPEEQALCMHPMHYEALRHRIPYMFQCVCDSNGRPKSYRKYNVSAIGFAYNSTLEKYGTFLGVNIKPIENMRTTCAEAVVMGSALAAGYDVIIAIMVAGVPQEGDEREVLYPCDNCLLTLQVISEVPEDAYYISWNPSNNLMRMMSIGEILKANGYAKDR